MPSRKTECSELSVAFGILKLNPVNEPLSTVLLSFNKTLSESKYKNFVTEFNRDKFTYRPLYELGLQLRANHFPLNSITRLEWTGPQQQATTTSLAKDILAGVVPISVKLDSNVVANYSPYNLLESIPSGSAQAKGTDNWYLHLAFSLYQDLYSYVRIKNANQLPDNVSDFEKNASKADRKLMQNIIKDFNEEEQKKFAGIYISLNHQIAKLSSQIFNKHISDSLKKPSRNAVLENLIRAFFRINAIEYILCGIDHRKKFGVLIPDLSKWKRNWRLQDLKAIPDLKRKQCVVNFEMVIKNLTNKKTKQLKFHAEIRWSHGKFCGNPEAKLYKEFLWRDVPFFEGII